MACRHNMTCRVLRSIAWPRRNAPLIGLLSPEERRRFRVESYLHVPSLAMWALTWTTSLAGAIWTANITVLPAHWFYPVTAVAVVTLPLAVVANHVQMTNCEQVVRRNHPSRCRTCGYDLHATPDRCPECGTVPAYE